MGKKVIRKEIVIDEKTLLEAFTEYRNEKAVLGNVEDTLIGYDTNYRMLLEGLSLTGNENVAEVLVPDNTLKYITYLRDERKIKPVTINTRLEYLRAFANWCAEKDYIEKYTIPRVKQQEEPPKFFTDEEVEVLLKRPPQEARYPEWRTWVIVNWILATGNRCRTIINIQMKDIDLKAHTVALQYTKNDKAQTTPLSAELCKVLKEFIAVWRSDAEDEDYLFCSLSGEQLTRDGIKIMFRKYCQNRGLKKTSLHGLRHTFARLWIINGGDVFQLQQMLGHSSLEMTRHYVKLFSPDLQESVNKYVPLDIIKGTANKEVKKTVKRSK